MKKLVLATVAMIFLALQSLFLPVTGAAVATVVVTEMAWADCVTGVNCNQPTGVGKGQKIPVWEVLYCIVGPANGDHERIACNDPRAVHLSPRGRPVVCFIGSDNKPHWDRQDLVSEGRNFINQCVANCGTDLADWQPNWQ